MKLLFAPPSPFARKARAVVIEKNLQDRVELVAVNPMEDPPALLAANPLGKIPALVCDDGTTLLDSPLVCAYLDSVGGAPRLHVPDGPGHFAQQRRLALIDGLLDAAVAARMEALRPAERQHAPWVERQTRAVRRALTALETDVAALADVDMAYLAGVIALDYLDFRLPELGWRESCPALDAWHRGARERPSLIATRPPGL